MHSTQETGTESALLSVRNLSVTFRTPTGPVVAVDDVNLDIHPGEVLAIVGESGSGKTQASLAILGLSARNATTEGSIFWKKKELLGLPEHQLSRLRAEEIAMVFQNPMTSLNPYLRISTQMMEGLPRKDKMSRSQARKACIEMLGHVQISDAEIRFDQYPHEFSGGMQQRIMIAMGLLRHPQLLIADEPMTALDVTVQMQVVQLLERIRKAHGTAIMLISHNMGLVASISDTIAIMYSGQVVETGPTERVFSHPCHPYTRALLDAIPRIDRTGSVLQGIAGEPPDPLLRPSGCPFHLRCRHRLPQCIDTRPSMEHHEGHSYACHLAAVP